MIHIDGFQTTVMPPLDMIDSIQAERCRRLRTWARTELVAWVRQRGGTIPVAEIKRTWCPNATQAQLLHLLMELPSLWRVLPGVGCRVGRSAKVTVRDLQDEQRRALRSAPQWQALAQAVLDTQRRLGLRP